MVPKGEEAKTELCDYGVKKERVAFKLRVVDILEKAANLDPLKKIKEERGDFKIQIKTPFFYENRTRK